MTILCLALSTSIRIDKIVVRKSEIIRVTLKMGEHFIKNRIFSSNECNVVLLKNEKMYLYGYKIGENNKIYQSRSQITKYRS